MERWADAHFFFGKTFLLSAMVDAEAGSLGEVDCSSLI
jgi:hypothetical protein